MNNDEETANLDYILSCLNGIEDKLIKLLKPRLMNVAEAASYLGRSESFLNKSRVDGVKFKGPVYVELGGRVMYDRKDLDRYIDELPRKGAAI